MLKSKKVNIAFVLALIALMVSDNYSEVSGFYYLLLIVLYVGLQAYGSIVLKAEYFVSVKSTGDTKSNEVALTFDDGPVEGKTDLILDVLKQFHVEAAFFCIGKRVEERPKVLARIHAENHLIGNHSYWHGKTFDLQTPQAILSELENTDSAIAKILNLKPRFFRPPYGVTNPMVASAIRLGNYETIGWSLRSMDTVTKDPERLLKKVTSSVKGGDVVLFHDFCDSTIAILPAFIKHLQENGFKIVRLDTLLNEKAYA